MFPSTLSTFTRPTASDRLNNPSHATLHNTVSSALGQVEAVIGVTGANSVVGTMMYDIHSPDSNGGGHIQTANKGGTGQTSYTKGDLLVATSASALAKLAVGNDGQILVVNSSALAGVNWGNSGSKIITSASVVTLIGNDNPTRDQSILSITIPGSTLGTNNAVRGTVFMRSYTRSPSSSVLFRAIYGGDTVASIMWRNDANAYSSIAGTLNYTLIANDNVSIQRGILEIVPSFIPQGSTSNSVAGVMYNSNTSSVNSSINKSFGITMLMTSGNTTFDGYMVEKIT